MLKKVDEIAADRKARVVAATKVELPPIFWQIIIALLVILSVLATFSEATSGRAVALAGQGFALALLVALVFIFDEPFKGHSSVSPELSSRSLRKCKPGRCNLLQGAFLQQPR